MFFPRKSSLPSVSYDPDQFVSMAHLSDEKKIMAEVRRLCV